MLLRIPGGGVESSMPSLAAIAPGQSHHMQYILVVAHFSRETQTKQKIGWDALINTEPLKKSKWSPSNRKLFYFAFVSPSWYFKMECWSMRSGINKRKFVSKFPSPSQPKIRRSRLSNTRDLPGDALVKRNAYILVKIFQEN